MSRYEPYYKSVSKLGEIPWKKTRIRKLLKFRSKKWGFILSKVKRLEGKVRRVSRNKGYFLGHLKKRLKYLRKGILRKSKKGKVVNKKRLKKRSLLSLKGYLGVKGRLEKKRKRFLKTKLINLGGGRSVYPSPLIFRRKANKKVVKVIKKVLMKRKKKGSWSEKLLFGGSVSRKFRSYSKVWSGRFNYKKFLGNQQYFRKWYGKRKIKLYEIRKMSRMLLKKSSNSKVSLNYYFTKYLSMDPAIFFVRQGFIKSLSEGRWLMGLKKLKVYRSYPKIKGLDSLGFSVFKVEPLISLFFLGSYYRKREKMFKANWLTKLTQTLIMRWFSSNFSYFIKNKGIFGWPEISYLLGVLGRTNRPRIYFSRSKYLIEKKKVSIFGLSVLDQLKTLGSFSGCKDFGALKKLVSFESLYLDFICLKDIKQTDSLLKSYALESKGISLSNWEKKKDLISKELKPKNVDFLKVIKRRDDCFEAYLNDFIYVPKIEAIIMLNTRKGKALKKVLSKKKGLKKELSSSFILHNLLKLKNKNIIKKNSFKRLYLYFRRDGKFVNFLPELKIRLKSIKHKSLRKAKLKSKMKRVKKVKKYNLQNKISSSYEVNYKTLSIFNVGKFSQVQTKNLEYLPENLGSLCTRLSY